MTIRIAIIGFGKIARDQHAPAIASDPRFKLVAIATRSGDPDIGVPCFADLDALLAAMRSDLDAVAICTPPAVRYPIARRALAAGLAVLLEKPPAATLGEIEDLEDFARRQGCCLYAGWHSQHAAAVRPAAALLKGATVQRLQISWREDVRKFHPGQDWLWEPSSFGVFDPGINALSIATAILPMRLFVTAATLEFPEGRDAPIAAKLCFAGESAHANFDWRYVEGEEWTIGVGTAAGRSIELREGGARLLVDSVEQPVGPHREYPSIYARFADLVMAQQCEVDREPLRIVADAFLVARRVVGAPFSWAQADDGR